MRAHTQTHACAQVAHTGTFRQTNVSLAGVKLWHLAVRVYIVYMLLHIFNNKKSTRTQNNGIENRFL